MAHYFLHIRDGSDRILDPEGDEYFSAGSALDAAVLAARELVSQKVRRGDRLRDDGIEVVNEKGQLVGSILLKSVVL